MSPEPRTETEALEQRITDALTTIRREWPHMLPVGPPPVRTGTGQSARITADDHATTGTDIDPSTRLVSLRREVATELARWCRRVIKDRPITATPVDGSDVPAMCTFLERHAQWLSGHRDADEAADRIAGCTPDCEARTLVTTHSCTGLVHAIRKHTPPPVVDKPLPPKPRHIGTCPLEWESETEDGALEMRECGGNVRAFPSPYTDPTRAEQMSQQLPTCDNCGTAATVDWWYQEMHGQYGVSHLVTVDELIAVIAVRLDYIATRGQVRVWQHRGKIDAAGKDSKGRTLYRHDEVITAIQDDPVITTRGKATA